MALALFVGGLATDATDVAAGSYAGANEAIGFIAIVTLWWRRRSPRVVAAVAFAAGGAAPMAGGAAIVAVYSLAAHHRGRWSPTVIGGLAALYVVAGAVSVVAFEDEDLGVAGGALIAALLTGAAYGWGLAVRSRRELVVALAERAERAESEQHARVADARRAERSRIAAEMHDVLGHRLSLLSLHAGAIELRPDAPPEELTAAASTVRVNAHLALEDLRAVVGVLRADHDRGVHPLPTLADIDGLVEESRSAGMDIDAVATVPAGAEVPPELARHAYRVVREALTNARKHAPGEPVVLAIEGRPGDGLRIEVSNSLAVGTPTPAPHAIPGAGFGLVGLQERVELAGGRLDRVSDGAGHHLRVWLPWPQ